MRLRNHSSRRARLRCLTAPAARLGAACALLCVVLLGFAEASWADGGLILGNPAEKDFNAPMPGSLREEGYARRGAAFSDQDLVRTPDRSAETKLPEEPVIRQVSGTDAATNIWDNIAQNDSPGMTFADWGIGPTQSSPFSAPTSPSSGNTGGMSNSFGFGMGAVQGAPPSQGGSFSNVIPYFTTDTESNASPFGLEHSNLSQANPTGMGAYGYGYYDPATGSLYTVPPPAYQQPYSMGMPGSLYPGMDYQGAYAGMSAYPNGSDYFGAMSPGNNSYGAASAWPGFYGTNNNLYGSGYDGFGGHAGSSAMMNDPNMLYQALLQQEAIRREVEEEIAAEEAAERAEKEGQEKEDQWGMKSLMPLKVSSPLGSTLFSGLKTMSPFSTPQGPHKNCGRPLDGVSWLDRPYYFGGFVGGIDGSELVSKLIKQKTGGTGGLNFGYNFNEYWGLESRLHFASIDIKETTYGRQVFEDWFKASYPGQTVPPLTTRSNQLTTLDVAVHYYPLGDAQFRPFFKYGLGIAQTSFIDTYGQKRRNNTVAMPIGVGLRYWWNPRLAIQVDVVDNILFSRGVTKTQYNWALTIGITYRFGGSSTRRPYYHWPRTPSYGSRW